MGKQLDHTSHFDDEFLLHEEPPSKYNVVLHNDNYTTMDFVVEVLKKFFSHSDESAIEIMLAIHHKDKGICGVYTAEIAETKVALVNEYAKANQYPLLCTMEKA